MQWTADGLVLTSRPHGEGGAIIEVFSRDYGRFSGLVRGGHSRRLRPVLQPGNMVQASWRARLSEHLGTITIDAGHAYAAEVLNDGLLLNGLTSMCSLLQVTPERQAYSRLYDTMMVVLCALDDSDICLPLLVRFEIALLEELGFGLDLSRCAATGSREGLTHVSPRSGRAVSTRAAAPYLDRLFILPGFLRNPEIPPKRGDTLAGFELTGHFLERRVYLPNQMKIPPARQRFLDRVLRWTK